MPTGRRIEPSRSRQEQNTYRYGRGRCGRHFAQLPHLEHRKQIENAYVVVRKLGKATAAEAVTQIEATPSIEQYGKRAREDSEAQRRVPGGQIASDVEAE